MQGTHKQALKLALGLAGISALLLGMAILLMGNRNLFLLINQKFTPALGQAARLFSLLGESWAMGFLLILSLWLPLRNFVLIALTWLSGAMHSWLFKLWLCKGWPRPYQYFSEKGLVLNLAEGVKPHHWNSFPSGHTITAFSLLLILPALFPRIKPLYLLLAWLLAFGCGISRIVLVQHWPADVLGGIVLGCSASLLVYFPCNKYLQHSGIPEKSLLELLKSAGK